MHSFLIVAALGLIVLFLALSVTTFVRHFASAVLTGTVRVRIGSKMRRVALKEGFREFFLVLAAQALLLLVILSVPAWLVWNSPGTGPMIHDLVLYGRWSPPTDW